MEVKLWTVACVLLLALRGAAEHDDGHAFNSSTVAVTPEAPDAVTAAGPNGSEPSPTAAAAAGSSSANGSTTLSPSLSTHLDNSPTELPATASTNQSSAPHLHLDSTTLGPARIPAEHSHTDAAPPNATSSSVTQAGQVTPPVTSPITSPSTSASPSATAAPATSQHTTTTTTPTNTTGISTSSHQGCATSASTLTTSPKPTHQPDGHPETSGVTRPATTTTTTTTTATTTTTTTTPAPSSTSAQTKPHGNSPSQLNVGGDTTILHQTPTLDPLLAGLVSAFVITAVIATLLLFLKLRRRNSRPEFRRLQDLPMDEMEDTPLSMYSY